jgi:hypothetical protein
MVLSGGQLGAVMLNALAAMTRIFLVGSVGYLAAKYPLADPFLSPTAMKNLSRLCTYVLIPPLIIASLGSSVNIESISTMSVLVLFSLITTGISFFLANTVGAFIQNGEATPQMSVAINIAIASPNIIAFPLIILQTMCGQTQLNQDFDHSEVVCFTSGTSMLFIYSIGWNLTFWSYSFPLLMTLDSTYLPSKLTLKERVLGYIHSDTLWDDMTSWCTTVLLSQNMVAIYIGLFIGLIAPLRLQIFGHNTALSPLGAAIQTLGEPVVCLNTMLMCAALSKVQLFGTTASTDADSSRYQSVNMTSTKNPIHLENPCASESSVDTMLPPPSAAVVMMTPDQVPKPHWRCIAALFVCRLFLCGLLIIPILEIFVSSGIISPHDRLLQFVIILEAVAPPAQILIVNLNQLGLTEVAGPMAYLYVFMYLSTILTVTMWVSIALSIIY